MDQDLIAYLDRRFSSLEQRVDEQVQALREETTQRFDRTEQRIDQQGQALREETTQRFDRTEQRIDQQGQALREETVQGFARVDQQVRTFREETSQRFDRVDQRFESLEADVRRAYVAIEDLRDEVRLVAEGVSNGNEQLEQFKQETAGRFGDLESLLHQLLRRPRHPRSKTGRIRLARIIHKGG